MNSLRASSKKLMIAGLMSPFLFVCATGQAQRASNHASRELEMTVRIEPTSESQSSVPKFRVELRNVGDHDLILNLGFMLANGRNQYVNGIDLMIIDPQGKARQFDVIGPPSVAGRMDPFTLPLPAGSTFSIPVDLDKYWAAASKEFEYKFQPGRYSLEARFRGKTVSPQEANLDMKGIALMPYWTGTATSNRLQFEANK